MDFFIRMSKEKQNEKQNEKQKQNEMKQAIQTLKLTGKYEIIQNHQTDEFCRQLRKKLSKKF